ncbi:aldo/keto reductase [Ferruginivarius sediminum]|uniref:Aldo/keto reductase n=1 Tax=Ferruginivarius sediminum TaxID=2661937 RepID=A0A369T541_9PROT|nr:aldo/keto reductase [Ferruginivarius sediminum]RDD60453.1 aldo/keto reductase [Ferruginivarius sediminum]
MPGLPTGLSRRVFLGSLAAAAVTPSLAPRPGRAAGPTGPMLTRAIPATGERVPVIGMGSWITFNVGGDKAARDQRVEVLRTFFEMGGGMVDSSPMYGSSEEVIGYCLERIGKTDSLFSATKVWHLLQSVGKSQMAESRELWGVDRFDLMQIHNLLNWEGHLETLLEHKEQGRIRYIGITTSHGSRHGEMERIMTEQPIDFVQFTYNILDREAERRLLPLAAERGLGVIINRPFRRKQLIRMFEDHPLPEWAGEIDCRNWPQFLLKFIVSHPAVTCAIPATSRVDHMEENMGALYGRLPDQETRARMVRYVENL